MYTDYTRHCVHQADLRRINSGSCLKNGDKKHEFFSIYFHARKYAEQNTSIDE